MERIVGEFAAFARLPKPEPGAIDVAAWVNDTLGLYTPEDVEVSCEVQADLSPLRADREQLTQVLVNLLKNACDAARERASPVVRVRVEGEDGSIVLHVEDSGPGIPKEQRERVMEPYVTTKADGSGLGLAIVKRIVLDHSGTWSITSSALGGACFTIRLPIRPSGLS
jgi:nitrogen fixation/metabolism regulation signal transduction histidine kinase